MLKYLPSWAWWCPPIIPAAGCWVWTSLGCTVILPTNHPPTLMLTVTLLCSLLWHLIFQLCVFGTCGISIAKTCNCLSLKTGFWTSADSGGVETYFKLHFIPAIILCSLGCDSYCLLSPTEVVMDQWTLLNCQLIGFSKLSRRLVSRLCLSTWYKLESSGWWEPELFGGSLVMFGIWYYHFCPLRDPIRRTLNMIMSFF